MKTKKAVLVCSNAGLDYIEYPKDITILRSVIHFGTNESFNDFIDMDAKTFYERIDKDPNDVPKTSYVSIGKMHETFERLQNEGYDEALIIVIAKPLSGLHDALILQAENFDIKITVFDSKTIALAEAIQALTAHKMYELGYETAEVLNTLEQIRVNNKWYFAVDTLKYLVKNGRLSKLQGTLGTLLRIKPLLTFDENGSVETVEKIKTTPKALRRVLEKYIEETKDKNVLTFISHAHNDEAVAYFIEEINKIYPERKILSSYLTPVVGAHTGPKAIGVCYLDLDKIDHAEIIMNL